MLFREKVGTLLHASDRLLWLPKCFTCCRGSRSSSGCERTTAVLVCTQHRFFQVFSEFPFSFLSHSDDPSSLLSVLPCFNCQTKTTFVCLIKYSVVIWTVSPVNIPHTPISRDIKAADSSDHHQSSHYGAIFCRWSRGIQTHPYRWPHPQQDELWNKFGSTPGVLTSWGAWLDLFGWFYGSEHPHENWDAGRPTTWWQSLQSSE